MNKSKEEIEFRILESKGKALLDREIMETFLSAVHERPQAQEIAKNLVNTYTGVGRILGREMDDLKVIEGVTDSAVAMIMCVKETLERVLREKLKSEPIMDLQGLVEYLNVSIGWVKDRRKAIVEGVKFQRLRGTPASLKIALKWANIEDITIIEEPPGKHFFELQIGIRDVPNDFFVDAVVELAKLSLPARSRLMRIFNDYYNVDRFILGESIFGSLLSDYSGRKVEKDGPVLSFGRVNFFRFSVTSIKVIESYLRNHYEQTFSNDIYRLDVAVLGETETHTKDYKGIYERSHQWYNLKALYPLPQSLLPEIKFAKAQIVLSDSWNLGEINACFPVGSIEEEGNKFVLGNDKLSWQRWNLKHKPILERFSVTHHYKVENYTDQKITNYVLAEHNVYYKNDLEQKDSIHELEKHILVFYPGVLKWHEHRHLHRSWKNSQAICVIS